jgi:hypothetical protein
MFAGTQVPEPATLNVDKDRDHCLAKGPLVSEKWSIHPQNKGVRWGVVFLKPPSGQKLDIHETLRQSQNQEVVVDQPKCAFEPHVVTMHTGQILVAKNSSSIVHNMVLKGLKNDCNDLIPSGRQLQYSIGDKLLPHYGPVRMSCGAHSWMNGYAWIFDHPYHAVTDADGKFEIKLAPAGEQNLLLWHEAVGYIPDSKGKVITVKGGTVTDVGTIEVEPKE